MVDRAVLRFLAPLGIFLLAWQAGAWLVASPLLVPPPATVATGAVRLALDGELFLHLAVSLQRLAVGLALGVPIGVILGCLMGRSPFLNRFFDPFLRMANATPAIALIPFSLLWLGVTEAARYALLMYTVALTVTIAARHGVREVPRIRLKAASTLGVRGAEAFVRVVIPSACPAILAGIRTAIGLGVMVIVAAEMLGATSGLGFLIMEARSHFNTTRMFIGVIGLGLLSLGLDRGFGFAIERWLRRWSPRRRVQ